MSRERDSSEEDFARPRQDPRSTVELTRTGATSLDRDRDRGVSRGSMEDDSFDETGALQRTTEARRELRRMRRQTESSSSGTSDVESRREGRRGPRSPQRERRGTADSQAQAMGEENNNNSSNNMNSNNNNSNANNNNSASSKLVDEYSPLLGEDLLVTVTPPLPLPALPSVTITPKGSLANNLDDATVKICMFCQRILGPFSCSCLGGVGGISTNGTVAGELEELDVIRGDIREWVMATGKEEDRNNGGNGFSARDFLSTDLREIDCTDAREDGVFRAETMNTYNALLSGEVVESQAADKAASALSRIQLSRISQRFLREEEGFQQEKTVRDSEPHYDADGQVLSSPLTLLKKLSVGPVFRALENPVDNSPSQPLIPVTQKAYGGVLGNWGPQDLLSGSGVRRNQSPDLGSFVSFSDDMDDSNKARIVTKVHIHQINIVDHPLFTKEDRLCVEIRRQFMQYRTLLDQQSIDYYANRLLASFYELKRQLGLRERGIVSETMSDERANQLLQALYKDVMESSAFLVSIRSVLEDLTRRILDNWREVCNLRENQKFNSSRLMVDARRVFGLGDDEKNDAGDVNPIFRVWKELSQAIDPMRSALKDCHTTLFPSQNNNNNNNSSNSGEPSKKSKKSRQQSSETESKAISPEEVHRRQLDHALDDLAALGKFNRPLPSLILRVSETCTVGHALKSHEEMKRRLILSKQRVKVVVKVDGEEVSSTLPQPISFPEYRCEFKQHFDLRLLSKPKSISLDIVLLNNSDLFGSCLSTSELLSTVYIPMASGNLNKFQNLGGSSSGIVTHAMAPVLGWFSFTSFQNFPELSAQVNNNVVPNAPGVPVQGAVLCSVDFKSSSVVKGPGQQDGIHPAHVARIQAAATPKTAGNSINNLNLDTVNMEKDFQHMLPDAFLLDPNDPRNDTVLYSKVQSEKSVYGDLFQLAGFGLAHPFGENGDNYANFMKFKLSLRLQLLKLRYKRHLNLFTEAIPLSDSVIETSEVYQQILAKNNEGYQSIIKHIDSKLQESPDLNASAYLTQKASSVDDDVAVYNRDAAYNKKIGTFLQRVQNSSVALDRNIRKKPSSTSVVVYEQKVYHDFEIYSLIVNLFPDVKRSLKPSVNARTATSAQVPSCDVLVQVIGAKNIPLRSSSIDEKPKRETRTSTKSKSLRAEDTERMQRNETGETSKLLNEAMPLDTFKMNERKRARTFVQVFFQENTRNTTCIDGPSPLWKQSLALPFCPPHDDFSPANINEVQDDIVFTLFDEIAYTEQGLTTEDEYSVRIEKRFLGCYRVPVSTVFRENRIEGIFRIDAPLFNLGYDMKLDAKPVAKSTTTVQQAEDDDQVLSCVALCFPSCYECVKQVDSLFSFSSPSMAMDPGSKDLIHPETQKEFSYYVPGPNITFMKLMLTLDPLLAKPPKVDMEVSVSSTLLIDRPFVSYTKHWTHELRNYSTFTKNRHYQSFVSNSDGLSVFICRYLTPQKPPAGFGTKRSLLHFVSMIPFLGDSQSFSSRDKADFYEDLWCTTQQTFEIGAGDEEEHGVALYNFWYYLIHYSSGAGSRADDVDDSNGRKSKGRNSSQTSKYPSDEFVANESIFLALGSAIPEGNTVYILYRDPRKKRAQKAKEAFTETTASILSVFFPSINEASLDDAYYTADGFLLINPCNGHVYSAADSNCPLKSIHTIATPYNIWANIQRDDAPNYINYNIRNAVHWRPYFCSSFPYPSHGLNTIQNNSGSDFSGVIFRPSLDADAASIENAIKNTLMKTIRNWRSKKLRSTTTFHSDASHSVTLILPLLEEWKRTGELDGSQMDMESAMTSIQEKLENSMSTILRTREIKGFPINIAFTDMASVEKHVKSLCVHEIKNPDVQFVLAVRVLPLTAGLFSVWIFFGTLEPRV